MRWSHCDTRHRQPWNVHLYKSCSQGPKHFMKSPSFCITSNLKICLLAHLLTIWQQWLKGAAPTMGRCRSVWAWGSGPPAGTWCAGSPGCCRWSGPPPPRSGWPFCSVWRPPGCLHGRQKNGVTIESGRPRKAVGAEPVFCLTLAAGGKHEDLGVLLAHPVNHVDLLQCLSHRVFVLAVAGNVGRPELEKKGWKSQRIKARKAAMFGVFFAG